VGGTNSSSIDLSSSSNTDTPSDINRLKIPSFLEGTDINGVKHYELNIQKATHTFFEGYETVTYAVNDRLHRLNSSIHVPLSLFRA